MSITILPKNRRTQDGAGNPIHSYRDEAGHYSIDIHDSDVHSLIINRHFIDTDSVTENPSVAITSGDTVIQLADTTGFTASSSMIIKDIDGKVKEHHFVIVSVTLNTSITVNRPVDLNYTTGATLEIVVINMNVSGTLSSPKIYSIAPPVDEVWHVRSLHISILDNVAMDDNTFGGLTKLTNGVALLERRSSNRLVTFWQNHAQIIEDAFQSSYTNNAPAGFYGFSAAWDFKASSGSIVRLDGALGDSLDILIQDNLSGLASFYAKAQGHEE